MTWVTFLFITYMGPTEIVKQVTLVRMARERPGWSLARQLLVLQVIIVGFLVIAGAVVAYLDSAGRTKEATSEEVVSVALTIADSPAVVDAVEATAPSA